MGCLYGFTDLGYSRSRLFWEDGGFMLGIDGGWVMATETMLNFMNPGFGRGLGFIRL